MREWLNTPFTPHSSHPEMDRYELDYTIPSPGDSTAFVEFSPNGRFLAVGDRDALLYILDKLAGFHPTVVAATLARPMALVWETSKAFYVGLSDGCFVHYRIDLRGNKLVKGAVNSDLRGEFPATAIALDVESRTLVLSVGPDVFAFRRIRATSEFYLLTNQGNKLMRLEVNSASSAISQTASISREIPESQLPRFRDLSALPQTTCSSSHSVGKT